MLNNWKNVVCSIGNYKLFILVLFFFLFVSRLAPIYYVESQTVLGTDIDYSDSIGYSSVIMYYEDAFLKGSPLNDNFDINAYGDKNITNEQTALFGGKINVNGDSKQYAIIYYPTDSQANISKPRFSNFNRIISEHSNDNTPPFVDKDTVIITPITVNVGENVSFTATITDDMSGVSYVSVYYTSPTGNRIVPKFWKWIDEPNILNLNVEEVNEIGQYVENGVWEFYSLYVSDYAGNGKSYGRNEFDDPETFDFIVNNPSGGDFTPPSVIKESISISPKLVNDGEQVTFSATVTDDMSGVKYVYVSYKPYYSCYSETFRWHADEEGLLEADIEIVLENGGWWDLFSVGPMNYENAVGLDAHNNYRSTNHSDFFEEGMFYFEAIEIYDHAGNGKYYSRSDFNDPSQFDYQVIYSGGPERKDVNPISGIATVSFTKSQVDIAVETDKRGHIIVTRTASNYRALLTEMKSADIYIDIEPCPALQDKHYSMTVYYDLPLPFGVDESALELHKWTGSGWAKVADQAHDVVGKSIIAEATGSGFFAVFAPGEEKSGSYELTVEIETQGSGFMVLTYQTESTIAVVLELESPAKYLSETSKYVPIGENEWRKCIVYSLYVDPVAGYRVNYQDYFHMVPQPDSTNSSEIYESLYTLMIDQPQFGTYDFYGLSEVELKEIAHDEDFTYYVTTMEPLSNQVWAARIELEPGASGDLYINLGAAYGNSSYALQENGELWDQVYGYQGPDDGFGFVGNGEANNYSIERGKYYAGNYITIEQHLKTTNGKINRYIDISSPFSHCYLYEDMEESGKTDISELFSMNNIDPGDEWSPTGCIQIFIEPQAAIDAGAQWCLTTGPDTDWKDSGESVCNLPVGTYTVTFKEIGGYQMPSSSVEVTGEE